MEGESKSVDTQTSADYSPGEHFSQTFHIRVHSVRRRVCLGLDFVVKPIAKKSLGS